MPIRGSQDTSIDRLCVDGLGICRRRKRGGGLGSDFGDIRFSEEDQRESGGVYWNAASVGGGIAHDGDDVEVVLEDTIYGVFCSQSLSSRRKGE